MGFTLYSKPLCIQVVLQKLKMFGVCIMTKSKLVSSSFRMKKWTGGMLITTLAVILILSYSYMGTKPPHNETQPQKQSAYSFFHNKPDNDSNVSSSSTVEMKKNHKPFKKPHLINSAGLDDLFAPTNISEEESRFLLVWSHMRVLLSRSDALPETAQGIKEAAVAWKELISIIDKDRASKANNTEREKNCPFLVGALDDLLNADRSVLDLPCGLVEDSSITVVGILDEHAGSFQIELVGSQLLGEPNPPIILLYNVSLPGDNITEEPFIVQNAWTNELGWGKEERCPSHGSARSLTVDGLSLCNVHTVASSIEENQNATHPRSDMVANVSRGSSHSSANFPFVEGNLFTATLWAGLEGYHMTVNGRHETSFAYRKNLDPWSVSGARVAGGLNLLSSLAKGLPVSEDHEIIDAEHLRAPFLSRKRLVMLVGVFSSGNNFERRMALRRSWMQYEAIRSGEVAVRFLIGLHKNTQVNFQLWKEAQAYKDIQFMPFVDYYSLISLKTIANCILGTKILPAKYIMKTDDDAFVRIDEVLSNLKGKVSRGLLYGLISFESSPQREQDSKWYISEEEWPHASYPPWAHGPGYIISRDIAKWIVRGHQEMNLQLFKLEDVAMGIWMEQFKSSGQEVQYVNDDRFYNAGCEANYVLAHYQGPRLVLCLWEKLQKEHQAICCE